MKKIVLFASTAMLVAGLTLTAAAQNDKPVPKKETKKECSDKKDKKVGCCDKAKTTDKKACCDKKEASKTTEKPTSPEKK
jgi:hypothetical protein